VTALSELQDITEVNKIISEWFTSNIFEVQIVVFSFSNISFSNTGHKNSHPEITQPSLMREVNNKKSGKFQPK
jgi:hypothetical protein